MYKVLVVSALSQELNIIKSEIKKLSLRNIKVSFLSTWMWNYNMILNLTRFLEKNYFDLVINIWVCWYKNDFSINRQKANSLFIQIWRIFNLSNSKELIIPQIINFWNIESIACSEKPVFDSLELSDEDFVDMESYGFEMVCNSFSISRILLKIPVDKVWSETNNFDFKKAEESLRNNINYKELFFEIHKYIDEHLKTWKGKYKIHDDIFDTYSQSFNFTFSQKEIFKKLYYRYISLVNSDFSVFYEANKNMDKKKFLKKLEKGLEKYLVR